MATTDPIPVPDHSPAARPAPRLRRRFAPPWSKGLLLVGSLLLTFLGLEIGFRTYDSLAHGFPFLWDPALSSKKQTQLCNPFLLFRGSYKDYRVRAKKPEQVIEPAGRQVLRIVCLGGSTTQDMTAFVEEGITYPTELQRLLNQRLGTASEVVVETINAGFAAHSTLHMLILLETELLDLRPDVLIVYENINDLMVNYFPGPTTPAYANKFLHAYYLPPELTVERATFLDHSRFYTWTRDRLRTVAGKGIRYTDDPIELRHAEIYRRNLQLIVTVAEAHGIQVVLGQQAMAEDQQLFENHFGCKSFNPDIAYPRLGALARHFDHYNGIVGEVAAANGIPCVNVRERLRGRHELFVDVVHLHAAGAREVGDAFANALWQDVRFQELLAAKRREAGATRNTVASEPD